MTLDEAVVFLKGYLDSETYTNRCNEAHQIAVEAVEKQIPKKVLTHNGYIECPYCETDIKEDKGNLYCSICGQRLDWSEEE